MIPKYAHSLGGKKTGIIYRKKALESYYKDPIVCKNCNNIIEVTSTQKVSEVKKKKFCNKSCAASFNNRKKIKKTIKKEIKLPAEKFRFLLNKTKKEIFNIHKNWQSARTSIRRHAQYIFDSEIKENCCRKCGYNKHIEICHIKAVSLFSDDSKISEINNKSNLIPLCPNCHWEYDNGLLKISG